MKKKKKALANLTKMRRKKTQSNKIKQKRGDHKKHQWNPGNYWQLL
jgi:hypothetical protein